MNKTASLTKVPSTVDDLLLCGTPQAWLDAALDHLDILLIDHANCEKKAASTALGLLYRYVQHGELLHKLSRLAREELRHFEQVLAIMQKREIEYIQLTASRYAGSLSAMVAKNEPQRLLDTLILGGIIEARSYERFRALTPLLDDELGKFYGSLMQSEERHFQDYFALAQLYNDCDFTSRIEEFAVAEAELVSSADPQFRFHSGVPS